MPGLTKPVIILFCGFVTILQIILWLPSYIYRCLVLQLVKILRPDLGPILDPIATLIDENYSENKANCSIICVLKIGGDLTLQQARNIFSTNVMQAKILTAKGNFVLRYPELAQCQVRYMGYTFWKQEIGFQIKNHVWEEQNLKAERISEIHEKMLNKTYTEEKSPWELIIIRNYCEPDDKQKPESQTLLILRIHHSMADGKSVVKLLVEGLGKKKLNAATAVNTEDRSFWQQVQFNFCLPYSLIKINQLFLENQMITQKHPWSVKDIHNDQSVINTALSKKISKNQIKLIAKRNKVRMSSVFLLIITDTIRKFHEEKGTPCHDSLPVYCLLPKENHPDVLKNHLYIGVPKLPVEEPCSKIRLQKCDDLYSNLRNSSLPQATEVLACLVSSWVSGMRSRLTPVRAVSTVVSNVAGEEVGFNVGSHPCLDFTMTVGFRRSSIGVQFFVLSYKDSLQFSVSTKGSVMDGSATKKLADLIGKECDRLVNADSVPSL
ncbi:unnamed protein product [Orchesella dallaii]|uniref:O-acyltransferase WSD1 C-terminal domain-containing protein n=1 Tax=Orchesella dallaii TaxID=48710 RepID=A0ABP1RI69_9HEXA